MQTGGATGAQDLLANAGEFVQYIGEPIHGFTPGKLYKVHQDSTYDTVYLECDDTGNRYRFRPSREFVLFRDHVFKEFLAAYEYGLTLPPFMPDYNNGLVELAYLEGLQDGRMRKELKRLLEE